MVLLHTTLPVAPVSNAPITRDNYGKIADGLGVPARRATTVEEFADALRAAFDEPGPHLIDAVVPSLLG